MLPRNHPDRIRVSFDDHRGGQCRAAPSGHPRPSPGPAGTRRPSPRPGRRAGAGQHGGQDARWSLPRWRAATASTTPMRCAPVGRPASWAARSRSTLGTFLRSFRWGHVRQLDRVSRELLARAWQAGTGSGDSPLTIDLDSTICETYGLAKEGARHHGYTGKRGYHPLLAVAA